MLAMPKTIASPHVAAKKNVAPSRSAPSFYSIGKYAPWFLLLVSVKGRWSKSEVAILLRNSFALCGRVFKVAFHTNIRTFGGTFIPHTRFQFRWFELLPCPTFPDSAGRVP